MESCCTGDKSSRVHSVSCQEKSDCLSRGPNQFENSGSNQSGGDCNEEKRKKKRKHDEEGEETVEQNGDVTGDTTAGNGSDSELHTTKPKKKKKMKRKDKELEEHTPSGDGVVVGLSDENLSTAMPIKKKKKKHKRKHMEEDGVDMAMQNLQKDSGTKGSDDMHAEGHELQVVGVEDKGRGVDVLAVEEFSSKKSHKRKHKEGKTPDRIEDLDSQCSVLSTACTDDGILQPSTKRLKVDSPGLEFVRSKKSKHRHSHKS